MWPARHVGGVTLGLLAVAILCAVRPPVFLVKAWVFGQASSPLAVASEGPYRSRALLEQRPLEDTPRLTAALAGRYAIERELGAGGMATVYLAHDLRHDRSVAVKVMRSELAAVIGAARFLREITISAGLHHPHILALYDSGEAEGFLYYVMPFVEGESLRDRLNREKQLPVDDALQIAREVADALSYAHSRGLVHRDIKPENILLHEGAALLADFGIALAVREAGGDRLTASGLSLGTPQYMSPEQATGERGLDARSDVYSLGAVVYEMLAGQPPHVGTTAQAVIARLLTERPTSLRTLRETVSDPIDAAVAKALAKVPADRFATAAAFAAALLQPVPPAAAVTRFRRGRGWPARAWLAGAGVVALGAVATWVVRGGGRVGRGHENAAAFTPIRLTTSGQAFTPVISPDGSQVAYAARECSEDGSCTWRLMVRETASDVERPIVEGLDYAFPYQWSRDGLWLMFTGDGRDKPFGHYVVSRLGGPLTYLGNKVSNFLPQGDTVVTGSIATATATARAPIHLQFFAPPWRQPTDSVAIDPPGGEHQLAAIRVPRPGQWLAIGWTGPMWGGGLITLHDRGGRRTDSLPTPYGNLFRWSVDARAILLPLFIEERSEAALLRIAVDASGRFGRQDTLVIMPGASSSTVYDLSEDGRSLVYESNKAGESTVWTATVGRTAQRRVATSSQWMNALISRDGRRVFHSQISPVGDSLRVQWFVTPFDSGASRPVTPPLADPFTYTADERGLFIGTPMHGGRARISVYDPLTGEASLFAERPASGFDIFPGTAGGLIEIDSSGDTVRLLDARGQEAWHTAIPDSLGRVPSIISSPDRSAFATITQPLSLEVGPDGNVGVALIELAAPTGTLKVVTRLRLVSFWPYAWSDDGGIYFGMATATDPTLRLYRIPATGGAPRRIGPIPVQNNGVCSLSGNARRWACTRQQWLTDLYLIRNFESRR